MCVCACVRACVRACNERACMHAGIHTHTRARAELSTHTCHISVNMHVYIYTRIHACLHTCMHACIHAYRLTDIQTAGRHAGRQTDMGICTCIVHYICLFVYTQALSSRFSLSRERRVETDRQTDRQTNKQTDRDGARKPERERERERERVRVRDRLYLYVGKHPHTARHVGNRCKADRRKCIDKYSCKDSFAHARHTQPKGPRYCYGRYFPKS